MEEEENSLLKEEKYPRGREDTNEAVAPSACWVDAENLKMMKNAH